MDSSHMKLQLKLTVILLIFFSSSLLGQNTELSKMDSLIYQITYKSSKGIFSNENNYVYKKDTFNIEGKLPNYFIPSDSIEIITDSIISNLSVTVEEGFFGLNLKLESEFPSVGNEMITDLIEISLSEYSIQDQNGLNLEFNERWSNVSIGGGGSFSFVNGEGESYNYRTFTVTNRLETKDSIIAPYNGSASYKLKFLKSTPTIKLTKESIGTEFIINEQRFKVIDIFGNKLVLDNISETIDPDVDLKLMNVTKSEEFEYKPYSLAELNKLKSEGELAEDAESFNSGKTKISQVLYNIFKNNQDISFEEYQSVFTPEDFKSLSKEEPKYLIISQPAPFEKIILYAFDYTEPIELKGEL